MTASTHSVTRTQPQSNTTPEPAHSWETKTRDELIAWLLASAQRLDTRAVNTYSRAERDRLLRMSAAARETAAWYAGQQNGGAL